LQPAGAFLDREAKSQRPQPLVSLLHPPTPTPAPTINQTHLPPPPHQSEPPAAWPTAAPPALSGWKLPCLRAWARAWMGGVWGLVSRSKAALLPTSNQALSPTEPNHQSNLNETNPIPTQPQPTNPNPNPPAYSNTTPMACTAGPHICLNMNASNECEAGVGLGLGGLGVNNAMSMSGAGWFLIIQKFEA